MSKHLYVDGEQVGRLIFRVDSAFVGLKTYFSNVAPRQGLSEVGFLSALVADVASLTDYVESALESTASVKVDARRMSTILNYSAIGMTSAVLCQCRRDPH